MRGLPALRSGTERRRETLRPRVVAQDAPTRRTGARRGPRSLACLLALTGLLGAWPVRGAAAGCAGPVLAVGRPAGGVPATPSAAVVVVELGATTSVSGEWFHSGCDDTGQGAGCDAPESEEEPLRGVPLVLEQGPTSAVLATADALDRRDRYGISWQVRVPAQFRPGAAVLRAAQATLPVQLEPGG